jgi:hypothetical protein
MAYMTLEVVILKAIYSLVGASGFLDGLFVFCAQFLVYPFTLVFVWTLLVHREPYERLIKIFYSTLALVISAGVFQGILHYFISRSLPSATLSFTQLIAGSGGFPAFITTWVVAVACVSYLALSKRLGFWLFIIAGIIGFAQMYTGLYWPLDIFMSIVIGVAGPVVAKSIISPPRS